MSTMSRTNPLTDLIIHGDCIEHIHKLADQGVKVDMILADLPYGRTQNEWDTVIPFDELWHAYKRIITPNACIALFADGLFMADLMNSNRKWWKYNIVWDKVLTTGFLNANRMPLRSHEEICIFYNKQPTYNPQKVKGKPNHSRGKPHDFVNNNYGDFDWVDNREKLGDMKHPTSIIRIPKDHPSKTTHATQKPIELLEWLIKTYTNEEDWILDSCGGSGTTAIAALNTMRNYIYIEKDKKYYDQAFDTLNRLANPECYPQEN